MSTAAFATSRVSAAERLSAVRLSDDMDPGLSGKVTEIFLKKVETYPEWGELLHAIPDTGLSPGDRAAGDTAPHA